MSGFIGLSCEKDGAQLVYDIDETIKAYDLDELGNEIVPGYKIYDYLVYVCRVCGLPIRLTYAQVEQRERQALAELRTKLKLAQAGKVFEFNRENSKYLSEIDKINKMREEYRMKAVLEHNKNLGNL